MPKWTISEYSELPRDGSGDNIPAYSRPRASVGTGVAGTIGLNASTLFVRFCGDTAAHVALGGAATVADPYVPAGAEFVIGTGGETQLTFIAG